MSVYQENRTITAAERETVLIYGVLVLLIGGGIGVYFPLLLDKAIRKLLNNSARDLLV